MLGLTQCGRCIKNSKRPTPYYSAYQLFEDCMIQYHRKNFEYWMENRDVKAELKEAVMKNTYPVEPALSYYMMPMLKFYYSEYYNTIQKMLILK